MTAAVLLIVKRAVQETLPEEKANELLAAMEVGLCEYNGDPVPLPVESTVIETTGEQVEEE